MSKRKTIETDEQLLTALNELFCDVPQEEPIKDIDDQLQAFGYDPDAFERRMQELISRAIEASPLNWRKRANTQLREARERLGRLGEKSSENLDRPGIVLAIQQALKALGYADLSLAPARFRNFEKASDSDLLSILHDLQYLDSGRDSSGGM